MTDTLRVAILGSTGSIGRQALDVIRANRERIEVVGLAAHSSHRLIAEQAREFGVREVILSDDPACRLFNDEVRSTDPFGSASSHPDAITAMAAGAGGATVILNALVGAAGLDATASALQAGLTLALANKESLVIGGDLIMPMVTDGRMLPVDSEHSAIFQCLSGEDSRDVSRIWLTASGGPFRGKTRAELASVTADAALAHPTWNMGPKITVDSSTLMNKGLEVIEAHHLFGTAYDDIHVVIHPQSCIHSMVEFSDGSVKAHLGATDMRIPIQYAFSHPRRWSAPLAPVDFTRVGHLDFDAPDPSTFRCLTLAFEAGRLGGSAPVVLNAANEIAVAAFLRGACGFLDIERIVESSLEAHDPVRLESLEQVGEIDTSVRLSASSLLA